MLLWKKTGKRNCDEHTGRADDPGIQKAKESNVLPGSSIEAREKALKVFTIDLFEIENNVKIAGENRKMQIMFTVYLYPVYTCILHQYCG